METFSYWYRVGDLNICAHCDRPTDEHAHYTLACPATAEEASENLQRWEPRP